MGLWDTIRDYTSGGWAIDVLTGDRGRRISAEEAEKQAAWDRAYGGSDPTYSYSSGLKVDPNTGAYSTAKGLEAATPEDLLPGLADNYDTRGLEAFRDRALAPGMSDWGRMQLANQRQEQAGLQSQLGQQQRGALAQSYSDLASRGGLSGGARERLARQGQRDLLYGRQGIAGQGAGQRLGITAQDEQQRAQMLQQLPGMEAQRAGIWSNVARGDQAAKAAADQFNVQARSAEKGREDAAARLKYEEAMKQRAADKLSYEQRYHS